MKQLVISNRMSAPFVVSHNGIDYVIGCSACKVFRVKEGLELYFLGNVNYTVVYEGKHKSGTGRTGGSIILNGGKSR